MDRKELQTAMDEIYTSFSTEFREMGNIRASNGYNVCRLVNKYICTKIAWWISNNVVDKWISKNEWQLLINRTQRGELVNEVEI